MFAEIVTAAGIAVTLPSGWHASPLPDVRPVVDPIVPLVVSSAPIRRNGRPCQIAQFAPPAAGVTVVVVEWRRSYPGTRWGRSRALRLQLGSIECYSGWGGAALFAEHGHRLGVYVMAGRRARPPVVRRARSVVRSLLAR